LRFSPHLASRSFQSQGLPGTPYQPARLTNFVLDSPNQPYPHQLSHIPLSKRVQLPRFRICLSPHYAPKIPRLANPGTVPNDNEAESLPHQNASRSTKKYTSPFTISHPVLSLYKVVSSFYDKISYAIPGTYPTYTNSQS